MLTALGSATAPPQLPDLFTPSPSVSSPSPASPLPEIGRTHNSPCTAVVGSSRVAARAADDNDKLLAALSAQLPTLKMDDWPRPKREYKLIELRKSASELRLRAREGIRSASTIRAYAATLMNVENRSTLTAYAAALEETLQAQDDAGADMQRGLLIAEGRLGVFQSNMQLAQEMGPYGPTMQVDAPESYGELAVAIAKRTDEHRKDVQRSEATVLERARAVHC